MKSRFTFLSGALCIMSLASCANSDYQNAMDKGIDSLGEQDYHQAAIYFEVASSEQTNDKEARIYFEQASQMEDAVNYYEQEEYISALDAFEAVTNLDEGLVTVQSEAEKWKKTILDEQEELADTEEEIDTINQLISAKEYTSALEQLQILNAKVESEEALSYYENELANLTGRIDDALDELENAKTPPNTNSSKEKPIKPKEESVEVEEVRTYDTYTNERFGFSIQYPTDLTVGSPPANGDGLNFYNEELEITVFGSHNSMDESIESIYQQAINNIEVPIAYDRLADHWFVLSYVKNGLIIYEKFFYGDNVFNRFIITYPENKQDVYGPVTTHISDTFIPSAN
ncbi:hypothetical protein [Pseudalkalibacillus hwajinpoensis]|uniref:hypothetical protein n=1 Tax=Guptibacillus hwajinpoensis TaxID=208199 RepID=UPI001CD2B50B|nr:hypothetical protein [Pseudalkalibacillus hwajinpoensis]MCA0992745.1 hypothetical protein [Pseudalkalibacillus hwajinpoensis]